MRFISTKVHGVLDYVVGLLLIVSPWLFGFAQNGAETWIPVILGIAALLYSLITDYELGVSKVISMRTHLGLDLASGILLAASPWIFGFDDRVYLPHLILGIFEIIAATTTQTKTSTAGSHTTSHSHKHAI